LQGYVEFAESPAGKRYHQVVLSAEKNVVERASQEFGKSLGKMIRQANGSSDKIILHLKDGRSLIWENHTEKSDRYCTYVAGGELCISKSDVARIGSKL
jgi:hypothetical protein